MAANMLDVVYLHSFFNFWLPERALLHLCSFLDVNEEDLYLKGRIQVFGVVKGQIEDSPQPLVKIFVLLHKTPVMTHKILGKKG